LYQVLSFLFSLDYCISIRTIVVQIQRLLCDLWCFCQRWCVFLMGSRPPLWCVLCNQGVWLLSGILRDFWGLDVALGKEWTSIKLFVLIFLSLISFKFVLLWFLITTDKNNQLFRKNNRLIFWNHIKNIFVFCWIDFYFIDFSLAFNPPSTFAKIFHKTIPPPPPLV